MWPMGLLFVIISSRKGAWPFIWTNLSPLHPRMLCAKFRLKLALWFLRRRNLWKVYRWIDRETTDWWRTTGDQKNTSELKKSSKLVLFYLSYLISWFLNYHKYFEDELVLVYHYDIKLFKQSNNKVRFALAILKIKNGYSHQVWYNYHSIVFSEKKLMFYSWSAGIYWLGNKSNHQVLKNCYVKTK